MLFGCHSGLGFVGLRCPSTWSCLGFPGERFLGAPMCWSAQQTPVKVVDTLQERNSRETKDVDVVLMPQARSPLLQFCRRPDTNLAGGFVTEARAAAHRGTANCHQE